MTQRIDVGIAMSRNSEEYLRFLLQSLDKTVQQPSRFRFVLGVNVGADIDIVRHIMAGRDADIFEAKPGKGYGSHDHGLCLDMVFARMDHTQGAVGMLLDCDIAFLATSWDDMLLAELKDDVIIVGTEYDGNKYLGFPNVICAMFRSDIIKQLGVSFVPEARRASDGIDAVTGQGLDIYGYAGFCEHVAELILDTGSELPRKVKLAGFRGTPLQIYRAPTEEGQTLWPVASRAGKVSEPANVEFMQLGMRGEEYQLHGTPIVTHIGRSYVRQFGADPDVIAWEKRVREWLA